MNMNITSVDVFFGQQYGGQPAEFKPGHRPGILRLGTITLYFPKDGEILREFQAFVNKQVAEVDGLNQPMVTSSQEISEALNGHQEN